MAWVVDTCIILDIFTGDPSFGRSSARFLDSHREEGLVLCPVTYIELGPAFQGNKEKEHYFLSNINVDFFQPWSWVDTRSARDSWCRYTQMKRSGNCSRRPVADIQIGAFAQRFDGLITRNKKDFLPFFPELPILDPGND